jgi:hypothetical protein
MDNQNSEAIDPELLAVVGALLHGAWWQSPLARQLGVTPRTILRWMSQKVEMPRYVPGQLLKLCERRRGALDVAIQSLRKHEERRLAKVANEG